MNSSPEGWIESCLRDLADRRPFAIVDGPFGTQLHQSEYAETGVPVVRVSNLSYSGQFLRENLVHVSRSKAQALSRSKVVQGDAIIAKTGATIGKVALFPEDLGEGLIASSCLKMSPDPAKLESRYLLHWLVSHQAQQAIARAAIGSTRATINIGPFGDIKLSHPLAAAEQQRISAVLDSVVEAIRRSEQVVSKLRQVKRGLLHDLLTRGVDANGELRPPPTEAPHLYKDSPLGRVPTAWEVAPLETRLAGIDAGKSPDLPDVPAAVGQWGVLKVSAVKPEGLQPQENKAIHDLRLVRPELEVRDGDLLMTRANTTELVGLMCCVRHAQPKLLLCDKTLRLRLNSRGTPMFVCHSSSMAAIRRQIEAAATGSSGSMKNISQQTVRSLVLPFPTIEEQQRICNVVDAANALIDQEVVAIEALRGLQSGLSRDLLTGSVRVPTTTAVSE